MTQKHDNIRYADEAVLIYLYLSEESRERCLTTDELKQFNTAKEIIFNCAQVNMLSRAWS